MQENIGNAEIDNLSHLLTEAQELVKQYESIHEQIMQQVDQQKESITLHEQNFSQSRISFEQEEQINEQQISSALQQINNLLRDPDVSPMRQVSSQINQNTSVISNQSNTPVKVSKVSSFSINYSQNPSKPENLLQNLDENIEEIEELNEEEKPLMTQLNPNQLPPLAPKKVFSELSQAQEMIVNSVLADNYFENVKNGYSLMELQELDNTITEQLSNYGDERMSELQSIVSSKSVVLQKPRLSQNISHLFDSLYKNKPETLELEIPQIKNQPDFLREQILENKLNKYMDAINSCINLVNNQINAPTKEELQQLLIQAELYNAGEELIDENQIEELCAGIEAEHAAQQKQQNANSVSTKVSAATGEAASMLDSFLEGEAKQREAIERDLAQYQAQQEQEEILKKDASATAELAKVLQAARECLGEQPPQRRTGSAKAILDKSLGSVTTAKKGLKTKIRTPQFLDGLKK